MQCNVKVISQHIPKTAGTSFRNILKSAYGSGKVVRFDINEEKEIRMNERLFNSRKIPSNIEVLHGHFSMNDLENLLTVPYNAFRITWVRDPVERVISNYYYLSERLRHYLNEEKRNLNILSKMERSLIEYASAEINRNRMSKFLTGGLSDFDFVGVTGFFHEDLEQLAGKLGWNHYVSFRHNPTADKGRNIDEETKSEILRLNHEDDILYKEALELRKARQ